MKVYALLCWTDEDERVLGIFTSKELVEDVINNNSDAVYKEFETDSLVGRKYYPCWAVAIRKKDGEILYPMRREPKMSFVPMSYDKAEVIDHGFWRTERPNGSWLPDSDDKIVVKSAQSEEHAVAVATAMRRLSLQGVPLPLEG